MARVVGRRRQRPTASASATDAAPPPPPVLLLLALLLLLAAAAVPQAQAFVLPASGRSLPQQRHAGIGTGIGRSSEAAALLTRRHVTSGFPGQDGRSSKGQGQGQQESEELGEEGAYFDWKHNWRIHYVKAGVEAGKPPILLCPGFGVGTGHFHRNLGPLAENHQTYALDYLGQGRSWPEGDIEPDHGLVLSIETWQDQIVSFIRDVVKEPCYIAGNSLGGFLATAVAATHPDLIKGVILWNATPFWSFAPNRKGLSEWVKRTIVPYDGTLPAPAPNFKIGSTWFDGLKNPVTVRSMLSAVYADDAAWDERLVKDILKPTEHRHGHAAFTSILFAPKAPLNFEGYLERVKAPILMLYGANDPWVTPSWGQKAKRQRPDARYIEISPAGHCPHHEAPETVNTLVSEWVAELEQGKVGGGDGVTPREKGGSVRVFREAVTGKEVTATYQDGQPRNLVEWLVASTILR